MKNKILNTIINKWKGDSMVFPLGYRKKDGSCNIIINKTEISSLSKKEIEDLIENKINE
jgi:hypothetical protein